MFWPPASTPPIVASGDACSLIIAMLTVTVCRPSVVARNTKHTGNPAFPGLLLQSVCRVALGFSFKKERARLRASRNEHDGNSYRQACTQAPHESARAEALRRARQARATRSRARRRARI